MWRGLLGFLLSGVILALPGAILPHWSYHLSSDYGTAGSFFLALNAGFLLALQTGRRLLRDLGIRGEMLVASMLAVAGFVGLIFASPPAPVIWAQAAMFGLGISAGLLLAGVFQLIAAAYQQAPASAMNLSGILFGTGSFFVALLMAWSAGTIYPWIPLAACALLAAAPLFWYGIRPFTAHIPGPEPAPAASAGFTSPAAILTALLLFFQFGSEWSVAGWLPLFLIQRLGISPEAALEFLAVFFASLVVGRIAAQRAMRTMGHGRLLMGSVLAACFGALVLSLTKSGFGAGIGVVCLGGAFSVVFPLVVEKARARFSYFHPVYLNGVFSIALLGNLVAPWLVGQMAIRYGIGSVMIVPVIGTFAVFILLLLIWMDAKLHSAA